MIPIILRPDQLQVKQEIYNEWNTGSTNVCAVMPTGTGKSILMSDIILDQHKMGASQCIIAHRTELVSQMSMHVARRGIKHRIIGPSKVVSQISNEHRREFNGRSFINPDSICAVGGIDTINARADKIKDWAGQVDFWYGDEFHHFLRSNKWGKGIELFPRARGLGVTASPCRADGAGLGRHADGLADALVLGLSIRESIEIGAITDYEILVPESDFHIDDETITKTGDYSQKKMREESRRSHIVGDVVTEYVKNACGKRAICFATDVETSREMAEKFNLAGIPAASVSAETPSEVRNEYVRRFKTGQIWILVNVDLFGEGFDVPACEVVIMARPTASLSLYLQMFGRALRTAPGKKYGLIIDHVSNWKRHGFPDKNHNWTLDRREKRSKIEKDPEEIPLTVCRSCSRPYERFHFACPYCGAEPPLPDPVNRTLEQVDGDLMLLDRNKIAEMRKAIELESPASVGQRVAMAAGQLAAAGQINRSIERHAAQQRLTAAINQWAGIQRHKGRDDRQSYRRFYIATGVDVLTALTLPRIEMEALATKIEGWYND